MKNIVLIGMPGAGKSTVGVVLAKVLGYDFLDSDLVIQQKDGRLLSQIIAEEGTDGFIRIENRINAGLDVKRSVIATGGSVVYGKEAMEHLKSIGTVVYLKLTYQTIENRLGDLKNRGVVLREGQTLADLYRERTSLYEKYADVTIEEDGLSIPETVSKIAAAYEEK
ncbi:MAG: shikimate kinase [Lachnospiraceae bacterium]|nr:shikimate kinase [Lachnospiraceae bacterium]